IAVGAASQLTLREEKGAFEALRKFAEETQDWLFGYLTYDLKNDVENLTSSHFDGIGFPALHFFQPVYLLEIFADQVVIHSKAESPEMLFQKINRPVSTSSANRSGLPQKILAPRIPKPDYLATVQAIRQHILRGDIYEMNFCQEFFTQNAELDPAAIFHRLSRLAKAPFSAFYRLNDRYLLCASPERFLKKTGDLLVSQPIKGTIRRGKTAAEDERLRAQLLASQKDRSENVMIVDLVRNDLHRSCRAGSVQVEELFGVYPFEQVFQLISTVTGRLKSGLQWVDALRNAFPMGSMTGAPKVRGMELIEQVEKTKRGLYSGAVGYVTPGGDFDFNVVIRSIFYNSASRYVSLQVGGAIVFDSVPEQEYEECLVKAKAMFEVLRA
ncbi:MAG: anthranilate synthase component I family protein, partial [Bacteroidota bacterium]